MNNLVLHWLLMGLLLGVTFAQPDPNDYNGPVYTYEDDYIEADTPHAPTPPPPEASTPATRKKYSNASKYPMPKWGDPELLESIISERDTSWTKLVNNIAIVKETDPKPTLQLIIRDLNQAMRDSYRTFMEKVGQNLFPLIIASDYEPGYAGVGSTFKLFLEDGSTKHIAPTPGSYERNKALSHIPLAIFTQVSPYFNYPTGTGWRGKMLLYQEKLRDSLEAFKAAKVSPPFSGDDLTKKELDRARIMLTYSIDYLDACLKKRNLNQQDFITYAEKLVPHLEAAMKEAAAAQVNHVYPALLEWKEEMGEEMWDKIYVVIPTVWPVADINPRQQIFEKLMKPEKIKTNLFKVENAPNEEFSRSTLGRIIGDRSMAQIIWGVKTPTAIDHLLSLSTRRDLVTTECEYSLNNLLKSLDSANGTKKGKY